MKIKVKVEVSDVCSAGYEGLAPPCQFLNMYDEFIVCNLFGHRLHHDDNTGVITPCMSCTKAKGKTAL